MKNNINIIQILLLLGLFKVAISDPDPLQDFCIADDTTSQTFFINGAPCINPASAVSNYFVTAALASPGNTRANPFGFNVTLTNTKNLPGSNTQGLAMARVDIAPGGLVPPHSHPRASEITTVMKGTLLVGFVDTSNRLFTQQLRPGDSFVFPRGLIHFLLNVDISSAAFALSGFNSQNPGAQLSAIAAFGSKPSMPDDILRMSFQISEQDVVRIRKNLGG